MSCKKCIDIAQKRPLVSYTDLAKKNPKTLANNTPTIPLGMPAK